MQLRTASRQKAKIKLGLQGSSGCGKTYSALLLAFGLCGSWDKIAVIDSENNSADLYANLGEYKVLPIAVPFTPERYIEAILACEKAGMEVIIIDSITPEWSGTGGVLDIHSNMAGNSFTNWAKITPRHNAFINAILQSPTHIIATLRTKQDYVLQEKNGKMIPEKVGLKAEQRNDTDYEFTLVFDIDIKHNATASKDRTGIFSNQPEFKITAETGAIILNWCNSGSWNNTPNKHTDIEQKIQSCKSVTELLALYQQSPQFQQSHLEKFTQKRTALEAGLLTNPSNFSTNGSTNINK